MIFECHVTCGLLHKKQCEPIAAELHWKTSQIERDPVLGNATYFYFTTYDADYVILFNKMRYLSMVLTRHLIPVIREKIELIMYDSKAK